jgi:hypothetical protein
LWYTLSDFAQRYAQVVDNSFKYHSLYLALGLLVNRILGQQVNGHKAPLGTRTGNPAQAIQHVSQRVVALESILGH